MSRKVKDLRKKKEEWDLAQKLWSGCEMKINDKKTRNKCSNSGNKENVQELTNRRRSSRLKQT